MQISQYLNIYIYGTIPTGFYDDLGTHRVHIGLRTGTHRMHRVHVGTGRNPMASYVEFVPVHVHANSNLKSTRKVVYFFPVPKFCRRIYEENWKKTQILCRICTNFYEIFVAVGVRTDKMRAIIFSLLQQILRTFSTTAFECKLRFGPFRR